MQVWGGLNPTRTNLSTMKTASHEDYICIVRQIQELQTYILNLVNNIQIMPDLDSALNVAHVKIDEMQARLAALILPQDVKNRLEQLEKTVQEIDQRSQVIQVQREIYALKNQVVQCQLAVVQLQKEFATEIIGFHNKVWGTIERIQKDTKTRLEAFDEKMQHLDVQLDLQMNIEKLLQLKNK